jgi:methylthioribose-1-phosphate isomerase
LEWKGGLHLLEQTLLPQEEVWIEISDVDSLIAAIRRLAVRGAPAIGCAAAYGIVLGVRESQTSETWLQRLNQTAQALLKARPTAVNLQTGVRHMLREGEQLANSETSFSEWSPRLLKAAQAFHRQDERLCEAIGRHGAPLLPEGGNILTHCNAGALATGGMGTALAVIYSAFQRGNQLTVFANETRPLLQGARITCWELQRAGIPVTLQCDSAAASAFSQNLIHAVVVGSDRIARNGDVANKIGTYGLAVFAHKHEVPFYVAAPTTTFDFDCPSGDAIPIEEREEQELHSIGLTRIAPEGIQVRNPAFDVTPAHLVTAIITEHGIIRAPNEEKVLAQAGM